MYFFPLWFISVVNTSVFVGSVYSLRNSLVPDAEEERLVHTDALPMALLTFMTFTLFRGAACALTKFEW